MSISIYMLMIPYENALRWMQLISNMLDVVLRNIDEQWDVYAFSLLKLLQ